VSAREEGRLLHDVLRERAEERGEKEWLRFIGEGSRTYAEAYLGTRQVGAGLQGLGVEKGDRVAMFLGNRVAYVEAWFAAHAVGAIAVPMNTMLRGDMLARMLERSGPKVVIVEETCLENVLPALERVQELETLVLLDCNPASVEHRSRVIDFERLRSEEPLRPVPIDPWDPSSIMHTSGTTGVSKGVVWTQHCTWFLAHTVTKHYQQSEEDVVYACLPLFHTAALCCQLLPSLLAGASIVIAKRFSGTRFWPEIVEAQATTTNIMGAMVPILLGREPSPLERQHQIRLVNSAPCPPAHFYEMRERFGFSPIQGYGLTDFGLICWPPPGEIPPPGSCGRPADGYECRIVDEFDEDLPSGVAGELVIRSTRPWIGPLGYWKDPAATAAATRNLWFHTGDSMYRDKDGWYYFVDRTKDAVRRRGENISSFEVEEAFLKYPEVDECAAYAIGSELTEDEVAVAVVRAPGSTVTAEELIAAVERSLPYFAVPRYVRFLDALPKTSTEKVRKQQLRDEGITADAWDAEAAGYVVGR
jgi:carnitine-CoA ligase